MDNYSKLREEANGYRVEPSGKAWERVEQKLDNNLVKTQRKKDAMKRRMLSVMGVSLILICTYLIIHESRKPTFVDMGQIASWEDLKVQDDDFYNLQNVRLLDTAYRLTGQ